MKVAVVTDSGSNIYAQKVEMDGLYKLPLQISDENKTYLEGEEVDTASIFKMIKEGKRLKTSLPPLGRIEALFAELKEKGYELIFGVPICSGLSGTINAMKVAAENVGINFDYIDCFSTASNELYLATMARKMFDKGIELQRIKDKLLTAARDSVTYIIPNDLKHLSRGGRLTPVAAALGGLLKIKPVLKVAEDTGGRIDAYSKVRTMAKAQDVVIDTLKNVHHVDENCLICIADVDDKEGSKQYYDKMRKAFPKAEIFCVDLISTVSVHTGIGCLGIQYIRKFEPD